ncbi:hypothetical protein C8F04DRAFT_1139777 [Mycena alexandri]|uniref:Uncharacterized protein n=1 Tax=Mycena alexandri TaxID=1745969 RepID=A0AAD6S6N2_9AGAR|nr:hypothetical protein C8F04DRAFT_1139777 [Mycena alexandri]
MYRRIYGICTELYITSFPPRRCTFGPPSRPHLLLLSFAMSDDELSATSNDEPAALTPAQKAAITRARKAAEAVADEERLHAEISVKGRAAKQKANINKVWKPSASVAAPSDVTTARKRAASAAAAPPEQAKPPKRSRAHQEQEPDSGMDVDEAPAVAKTKDKRTPSQSKVPAADGASSRNLKKSKAAPPRSTYIHHFWAKRKDRFSAQSGTLR